MVSKENKQLFSDSKFLNRVAKQMVITMEEFELNWKHQFVNYPIK